MKKLILNIFVLFLSTLSCSSENINLSPVSATVADLETDSALLFDDKKKIIIYSSEITNLSASYPKSKNDAVNREFAQLRIYLKDYVQSIETNESSKRAAALGKIQKSFKNLQNLRKYLSIREDEVLNRYMVRIKSNLAKLQAVLPAEISKKK